MKAVRTYCAIAATGMLLLSLNSNATDAQDPATTATPPASLKCKAGKTPTQVRKNSGRVVWKCVTTAELDQGANAATPATTTESAVVPASSVVPATPVATAPVVAEPVVAAPRAATTTPAAAVAPTATPAPAEPSIPVVVAVPAGSSPAIPVGLKATCFDGSNVFTSNGTCPVVKYKGLTTWAFSFIDNRMSFALVSYDANNTMVQNVTVDGGRYVWKITVDEGSRMATVWGQGTSSVSQPWERFAGVPLPANTAAAPAPAPATPVVQAIPTFGQASQSTSTSSINVILEPQAPCTTQPPATGSTTLSTTVGVLSPQTSTQSANCPN